MAAMDTPKRLLDALRRLNRGFAYTGGLVLLGCAALVLFDIVARPFGASIGGTDEISGYVMAIATAWGMAFAMTELAHVRIGILHDRLPGKGRAVLDLLAMGITAITVTLIAWRAWPVLERSLLNSSRANTPLETPLAWVQMPWLLGWAWFAFTAWALLVLALWALLRGDRATAQGAAGLKDEIAAELGEETA